MIDTAWRLFRWLIREPDPFDYVAQDVASRYETHPWRTSSTNKGGGR